jgi:ubiquinone/menaquinone biosynthesis C-methylase UbiE
MCECCQPSSVDFFDSIAPQWDSWEDIDALHAAFDTGLAKFGVKYDEHVLDVGCGTGNLTGAIIRKLSAAGRVTAIDISARMVDIARAKVNDSRVQWICDAVEHMSGCESMFDRVICYSVWPHLTQPATAARLFSGMLKAGGKLHVWHLKSREAINKIHAAASDAVSSHILVPAAVTADLLTRCGFVIEETQDDESGYLVTARKARS